MRWWRQAVLLRGSKCHEQDAAALACVGRIAAVHKYRLRMGNSLKDILALPVFAPLAGMPVDLYRDYWKHTWASVSRSLFNTLLASDVAGLFEAVDRSRITLIHGRHDLVAPLAHIRGLLERFPELTLKELRGDHHLYLMYPRLLNRLITERSPATEPERS